MPQDQEKSRAVFTQFGGLVSHADPRDIGMGATRFTNFTMQIPGQLTSRKGHELAEFANEEASTTESVLAMFRFETPSYVYACYETTDGAIRVGRTPS